MRRSSDAPEDTHSPAGPNSSSSATSKPLAMVAFRTSLDNLMLEATRQRVLVPLRDAVHNARVNGYAGSDIFHVFVLACDSLHGLPQGRQLLLRSLNDLAKIASLQVIPITSNVVQIVCNIVRKLLGNSSCHAAPSGGVSGSGVATPYERLASTLTHSPFPSEGTSHHTPNDATDATLRASMEVKQPSAIPADAAKPASPQHVGETSFASTGNLSEDTEGESAVVPGVDDELLKSILQMLMSFLSACDFSNAGLADLMGVIFTMHIQSMPGSVVEASCAATIEQRTLAVLQKLRGSGEDDLEGGGSELDDSGSTTAAIKKEEVELPRLADITPPSTGGDVGGKDDFLTAQMQMAAYVKDICGLCLDIPPKWLKLGSQHTGSANFSEEAKSVDNTGPVATGRLRTLLLRTLTKYFESYPITSHKNINIFFAQCVNQDIVPLVLRIDGSADGNLNKFKTRGRRRSSAAELTALGDTNDANDSEFNVFLSQKLGVTMLSNALPIMQNTMPTILRHSVKCVERSLLNIDVREDMKFVAMLLSLWREKITDAKVLQQLLLASSDNKCPIAAQDNESPVRRPSSPKPWYAASIASDDDGNADGDDRRNVCSPLCRSPFLSPDSFENVERPSQPFAEFTAAVARLLLSVMATADEVLSLDPPGTPSEGTKDTYEPTSFSMSALSYLKSHITAAVRPAWPLNQKKCASGRESVSNNNEETLANLSLTAFALEGSPPPAPVAETREVLDFLTVFTQSSFHIAETLVHKKDSDAIRELRTIFLSLHPFLFPCFNMSAQRLKGNGVNSTVMKGITNLVYSCCFLRLSKERSSYLKIFHTLLSQGLERPVCDQKAPQEMESLNVRGPEGGPASLPPASHSQKPFSTAATTALASASVMMNHVDCPLDMLMEKQHILNCVISIAVNMGSSLGDGWSSVAACLLFTPSVSHGLQKAAQQRHQHSGSVREPVAPGAVHAVEYLPDALRGLFISCALSPYPEVLQGLLTSFVADACRCLLLNHEESCADGGVNAGYASSLHLTSECCTLALLVAAGRSDGPPLKKLLHLWKTVRVLYQRIFHPSHLILLMRVSSTMEEVKSTLKRLVEDIAVLTAQFCRRCQVENGSENCLINRTHITDVEGVVSICFQPLTLGPYATADLVTRLLRLSNELNQHQISPRMTLNSSNLINPPKMRLPASDDSNDVDLRPHLLASVTELFDTIYKDLRKVPLVFADPEDAMGGGGTSSAGADMEAVVTLSGDLSLLLLKEVLKLIQGFGEDLGGPPWVYLLQLLRRSASMYETTGKELPLLPDDVSEMTSSAKQAEARFAVSAGVKQGIGVAFRTLETIQHSYITSLNDAGLRELIRCGGTFMTHRLPHGEEQRLNINLSAVQLLWSIADYSASLDNMESSGGTAQGNALAGASVDYDVLWCTLLLQLYQGCLDLRPEVRQSALKTLFSLVQAYSGRLYTDSWRTFLREVLGPLMDITVEATAFCTTFPATSSGMGTQLQEPDQFDGAVKYKNYDRGGGEGRCVAQLLAHFANNPTFFDDMRVTIMDSVCRVLVSHYHVMEAQLVTQVENEKQCGEGRLMLHKTVSRFIKLCAAARFVSRTTTGEAVALSATRALHSLMVASRDPVKAPNRVPLLEMDECEAAWSAVEKLFRRDSDSLHTADAQCTMAVVSIIVSALGDVVIMQRSSAVHPSVSQAVSSERPAMNSSTSDNSHPTVMNESDVRESPQDSCGYLLRYFNLAHECLRSQAVTDSYFFPSKVQVALIDVWKRLWPLLSAKERGTILSDILQQFPSEPPVYSFVVQKLDPQCGGVGFPIPCSEGWTSRLHGWEHQHCPPQKPTPLRDALPPGAHPSYLMELMNFFIFIIDNEKRPRQEGAFSPPGDRVGDFPIHAVSAAIRALGILLLLEYASPDVLAIPCRKLHYHIPNDFFTRAERCLEAFLTMSWWDMRKEHPQNPSPAPVQREADDVAALFSATRRESFLAFCSSLASLMSLACTVLSAMAPEQDTTTTKAPPESLLTALERLERLVLLLGKLIPHAMRHFSDVSIVADALHVLAPASSVEFPLFSNVARRSFSLLHQWSLSSGTSKPAEKEARQQSELRQSPMEGVEAGGSELQADGEGASLDRRLQGMARASVCIRNRAMLRRYLHDSRNEEARRMAKVALQTIALIHPIHDGADQVAGEESSDADDLFPWDGDDDDNVKSTKSLQRTLLQLVRLVAHTGDDPELNMLLSRAMMGVCSSLGFSEIP